MDIVTNSGSALTGSNGVSVNPLESPTSTFVLLIPDEYVGCILGRGGSTIRRLQWQTHTTIRVSNADEPFYPGTEFRMVSIISNSTAAMDAATQLILMQVAMNYSRHFKSVSVVIPDSMAGRVIGKGGERIGEIRQCCANAELSDRDGDERIMTIAGRVEQICKATRMVIDLVFHD